jgi:hypothetical protein
MGYTHYWRRPQELDASKFKLAVDDCKKICDALPVPLGDGMGENEPVFNDDCVIFNGAVHSENLCKADVRIPWPTAKAEGIAGIADVEPTAGQWFAGDLLNSRCCNDSGDGSYETFAIEQAFVPEEWQKPEEGRYFACCKTGFRPYDLCVQCCLAVFKEYFPAEFLVSSDGTDKQWNEARDVCQHILGYGLTFGLDQ